MSTTTNTTTPLPGDLPRLGAFLAERLREHFPRETERERQVLALAEEAGEFVGAYRRAAGMARRTGDWSEVEAELADVAITAHVTASVLDVQIHVDEPGPAIESRTGQDRHRCVMEVAAAAGWVTDVYVEDLHFTLDCALGSLISAVEHTARVLGIDLDAAVRAKAEVICSRGWRDQPAVTDTEGGRQWAEAMLDAADALSYAIETSTHDTTRFQRAYEVLFGTPQNTPDGARDDASGHDVPSCQPGTDQEAAR